MIPLTHRQIEATNGPLSVECVDRGIISFLSFIEWVEQLPYQRNSDRADYTLVFTEECGACSTKNALVAALALENKWSDVQLFLGIYLMSDKTNPGVGAILSSYGLDEIPEAHTYIKINGEIRDVTGLPAGAESFVKTLFDEIPIEPHQIGDYKITWHLNHLRAFAHEKKLSLEKVKEIREACIAFLGEDKK